jgi:hypothetical protein
MGNFEDVMTRGASHNLPVVLENGFVPPVQSTGVDKERLFKAVNLRKKGAEVDFAFGEKLFLDRTTLNPLKIDKLGDIPVPLSVKVFNTDSITIMENVLFTYIGTFRIFKRLKKYLN